MRVLVTGGAGFIGSHLCDALLARGDEVICMDNFATGTDDNIAHLRSHHAFSLIEHDVEEAFPRALDRVDLVFHLAAIASPWKYLRRRLITLKTSVLGTLHACEFTKSVDAKLVLASTSEVYGDPEVHPQHEGYWGHVNPIGPRSCYDEGKRAAEAIVTAYCDEQELEVAIARIFNTFGPRMTLDDGRPVINFIVQALKGEPLPIHGDGKQTRSFCYIDDLVRGLIAISERGISEGPINLGNPDERTIISIADLIRSKLNPRVSITNTPRVQDDPSRRCPDITKARRILGWEPKVNFEDGLEKTIEWVRQVMNAKAQSSNAK